MSPEVKGKCVTDFASSVLVAVPPGSLDQLKLIAQELAGQFAVATDLEVHMLQELAVATLRLFELDNQWNSLVVYEKDQAGLTFERMHNKQFASDLRQLRNHSAEVAGTMGQTWLGARKFAEIWRRMADDLAPGEPGPGLDLICEALLTQGLPDRIQHTTAHGWWYMSRFLALHPEPERAIKAWVRKSRSCDPVIDEQRAFKHLHSAPSAVVARSELHIRAVELVTLWAARAEALAQNHQQQRAFFRNSIGGPAVNDQHMARARKISHQFLKYAEGRVERLEKRLAAEISGRLKAEARQRREAEKRLKQARLQPARLKPDAAQQPAISAASASLDTATAASHDYRKAYMEMKSATSGVAGIRQVIEKNPVLTESNKALQPTGQQVESRRPEQEPSVPAARNQPSRLLASVSTSVTAP